MTSASGLCPDQRKCELSRLDHAKAPRTAAASIMMHLDGLLDDWLRLAIQREISFNKIQPTDRTAPESISRAFVERTRGARCTNGRHAVRGQRRFLMAARVSRSASRRLMVSRLS